MPRKRRIRRRPRRPRSIFRAGRIAHVRRGVPYHRGNSIRGLQAAKRAGKRKADRDVLMTSDRVLVVTHWGRPLKHGFRDPLGRLDRNRTIGSMTWAEVSRLRAPGNYRINTLETDLRECARLGIEAVLEPKGDPRFRDQNVWNGIKALADRVGCRVSGYTLRANAGAVLYMRRAGIRTTILRK